MTDTNSTSAYNVVSVPTGDESLAGSTLVRDLANSNATDSKAAPVDLVYFGQPGAGVAEMNEEMDFKTAAYQAAYGPEPGRAPATTDSVSAKSFHASASSKSSRRCGGCSSRNQAPKPLFNWMWLSFLRAALIPLLLLETLLIAAYIGANHFVLTENTAAVRYVSADELSRLVNREAAVINAQLQDVMSSTLILTDEATRSLVMPLAMTQEEIDRQFALRYAQSPNGTHYKVLDDGYSALWYSAGTSMGPFEREKTIRTERMDPVLRSAVDRTTLVSQAYLNTNDSQNRIYPFMDVLAVYAPDMDVSEYNFYYEADLVHNPAKTVVWTDVYVDPAGSGWMASAIAPCYGPNDVLEGVVGSDVTVETLVKQVLLLSIPWQGYGVLVGSTGTILALPRAGEVDFNLTTLMEYDYQEAVLQDTFKPEEYNLFTRTDIGILAEYLQRDKAGLQGVVLAGRQKQVAWASVNATGWVLLVVVDQAAIDDQAVTLSNRVGTYAYYMIGGLILFYTIFFIYLYYKARKMSRAIADPLSEINNTVKEIGAGHYEQEAKSSHVAELEETSKGVVEMGKRLGEDKEALLQTQDELLTAKEMAEAGAKMKSQFLATISRKWSRRFWKPQPSLTSCLRDVDEIRSPMNGVLGMNELLLETDLSSTQREYAEIIDTSAKSLLSIISEILDFSKLEAGKMELSEVEFDLIELVVGPMSMLAPRAQAKGVELVLCIDPVVPRILIGDPDKLRQVLVNLLSNAVKFTESGETVLRVRCVEPTVTTPIRAQSGSLTLRSDANTNAGLETNAGSGTLSVTSNVTTNPGLEINGEPAVSAAMIYFEVQDTGIGISQADQSKVFEAFAQADGSLTRRHGGTGLGLAISKELVRLFGGQIGVQSELGKGSSFWFTAKLGKVPSGGSGSIPTGVFSDFNEANWAWKGKKALLIDDNLAARSCLRAYLDQLGFGTIDTVEDATKGLDMLRAAAVSAGPYDVVLVDRDMPVVSGSDFLRGVAKDSVLSVLPCILLTPVGREESAVPNLANLVRLHKPAHGQSLRLALEQAFKPAGDAAAGGGKKPTRTGIRPKKLPPASALAETPVPRPNGGRPSVDGALSIRVLLAEDNLVNQKVAQRMLTMLGCQVTVVDNGLLAVQAIENDPTGFQLCLMDLQMPEMDGYAATREIRRREAETGRKRIPISALTANAMSSDRDRALECGMDHHISKPIKRSDLDAALVRFVGVSPASPGSEHPPSPGYTPGSSPFMPPNGSPFIPSGTLAGSPLVPPTLPSPFVPAAGDVGPRAEASLDRLNIVVL